MFSLIRVLCRNNAASINSKKMVLSINDYINNDNSSKLKEKPLECNMYECHPDKLYLIVGKYLSTNFILYINLYIYVFNCQYVLI